MPKKAVSTHTGKSRGGKKQRLNKLFKKGWVQYATIKENSRGGLKVGKTQKIFTVIASNSLKCQN